jgi:hypothetical protein
MKYEKIDAAIALQMKDVVVLLEDYDYEEAESRIRSLSEEIKAPSSESVREQKLINLRRCLDNGIRDIRRTAPLTATIGFREGLKSWLAHG